MILCSSRLTNDVIRNEADMFEKFSRRVEPKEANNLTQPLIHVSLQQTTEVSLLLFDTPTHTHCNLYCISTPVCKQSLT